MFQTNVKSGFTTLSPRVIDEGDPLLVKLQLASTGAKSGLTRVSFQVPLGMAKRKHQVGVYLKPYFDHTRYIWLKALSRRTFPMFALFMMEAAQTVGIYGLANGDTGFSYL